jgi:hypothetical protein
MTKGRPSKEVIKTLESSATTCAYQHQRQKDNQGRITSELSDYWMALQIVQDAFRENLGVLDEKTEKYLEVIEENGKITPGNLAKKRGVKNVSAGLQRM